MRDVEQVMRFYLIAKRVSYRSIQSLMDNPSWNPLLKLCVERLKKYPEAGISRCREIKRLISKQKFKFKTLPYNNMESGEEELPRGTIIDWLELKEIVNEIENYIKKESAK